MSTPTAEVSLVDVTRSYARCIGAVVFAPAPYNAPELQGLEQRLIPGASFSEELRALSLDEGRQHIPTELEPEDWGRESIEADPSSVAERRRAAITALSKMAINLAPSGWLHPKQALEVYEILADTLRMMCGRDAKGSQYAEQVMADIRFGLLQAGNTLSRGKRAVNGHGSEVARNAIEKVWPAIGGRRFHFVPQARQAAD